MVEQIINETPPANAGKYTHKILRIVIVSTTILVCATFCFLNYKKSILESDKNLSNAGYIWTDPTLTADYNFSIYKPIGQYREEVQRAIDSVIPIFLIDEFAEKNLIEYLYSICDAIQHNDSDFLMKYASKENTHNILKQSESEQAAITNGINNYIIPFIQKKYANGYINQSLDRYKINEAVYVKAIRNTDYLVEKNILLDKQRYSLELQRYCDDKFNDKTAQFVEEVVMKLSQPNLIFSEELTNRAAQAAEQSVKKTIGMVRKGEKIVERGQRLSADKILIIRSYNGSDIARGSDQHILFMILGCIGHAVILYFILLIFLILIRKKIWNNNFQLLLLSMQPIIVSFLAWLTFYLQTTAAVDAPIEYLVPIPALAMFIAIVFDSRTAFYTTVSIALLLAGVRGNDYFLGLIMLFTGSIAAYTVRDIEDRYQMFSAIIYIFIGFVLAIFAVGFQREYSMDTMMPQLFLGLINAIISPVITFALLSLINNFSKSIVTNLKLYELANKDHPLITELRERAVGTFEHSRSVAHLAKIAAKEIGANHHLARAGAMFHDIGKLNNPQLFTENKEQYSNVDMHSRMTPKQSATAIIKHVKQGIRKAELARLPQCIIDFISMHHGTSLVKHFYNVALNNSKETGEEINQADFRYSGPIPHSKETAILMLCDVAEAMSKSIPDAGQFVIACSSAIEDKIKDGQFDNANITLGEINKVKNIIINELKGKMTKRVEYMEIKKENNII